MTNHFEQIDHKNIELLRFYISRDIKRLDDKIQSNESSLLGYFSASLVDILIVTLFDDKVMELQQNFIYKILLVVCLLLIFWFVSWIIKNIHLRIIQSNIECGKQEYMSKYARQEMIDKFDNIACDGLLICEYYIKKYQSVRDNEIEKEYIKKFYLYEIIHHLKKSSIVFEGVYNNKLLYTSFDKGEYISSYRIDNFIEFSKKIIEFLSSQIITIEDICNEDLKRDFENLETIINRWMVS